MSDSDDDEIFDDPLSAARGRPVEKHYHYENNKNGNGTAAANKAVWWVAGIAVCALLSINGVIWAVAMTKIWALSESVATMQGQLSTLVNRQAP